MTSPRRVVHILAVLPGILAVVLALMLARIERRTDFRIFYESAQAWTDGRSMYPERRPNLHLPAMVAAYAPFTRLSETDALTVFTVISIGCAAIASWRIARAVPLVPWFVLLSMVLTLEGGWSNLWLGQEGLIGMMVVTHAWLADREGRERNAGAWMGLAIYAKPFLGGLLIYWMLCRRWRSVAAALAISIGLIVAGAIAVGPASYGEWWESVRRAPAPYAPMNGSLLGLWSRLFRGSEFSPPLFLQPVFVLNATWLVSVAGLAAAITYRVRGDRNPDRAWALILLGSLLASPLGWLYYLPIVTGPLLASLGGRLAWVCLWLCAGVLLVFRSEAVITMRTTAPAAIGIGSIYLWAFVLLFTAAWSGNTDRKQLVSWVPAIGSRL
jgi:hypothetical protein